VTKLCLQTNRFPYPILSERNRSEYFSSIFIIYHTYTLDIASVIARSTSHHRRLSSGEIFKTLSDQSYEIKQIINYNILSKQSIYTLDLDHKLDLVLEETASIGGSTTPTFDFFDKLNVSGSFKISSNRFWNNLKSFSTAKISSCSLAHNNMDSFAFSSTSLRNFEDTLVRSTTFACSVHNLSKVCHETQMNDHLS